MSSLVANSSSSSSSSSSFPTASTSTSSISSRRIDKFHSSCSIFVDSCIEEIDVARGNLKWMIEEEKSAANEFSQAGLYSLIQRYAELLDQVDIIEKKDLIQGEDSNSLFPPVSSTEQVLELVIQTKEKEMQKLSQIRQQLLAESVELKSESIKTRNQVQEKLDKIKSETKFYQEALDLVHQTQNKRKNTDNKTKG